MADYSVYDYSSEDYFVAGSYNLITSSFFSNRIYIYNGVSSSVKSDFSYSNPRGIAVLDGNLVSTSADTIRLHNGYTSSITDSFSIPGSIFVALTVDSSNGNVISFDNTGGLVRVHDGFSSIVIDSFTTPASNPGGIAYDAFLGNLISTDSSNGNVYIHAGVTSSISGSFSGPSPFCFGIAFDYHTGNLLYAGYDSGDKIYVLDGVSSSVLSSFNPTGDVSGITVGLLVETTTHSYTPARLLFDSPNSRHSYAPARLIQSPSRHEYSPVKLFYISDKTTHPYTPPRLIQSKSIHSYTPARLLKFSAYTTHSYSPPRLIQSKSRHEYESARMLQGPALHSYATFQLRASGVMSYSFELYDDTDTLEDSATGAPPTTVFTDLFTGVSDGLKTLYIRSVQKYKNLENAIDETFVRFRLLAGVIQPLLPNLPLSVTAETKIGATVEVSWNYNPTNEETPPTTFEVYAGAVSVDTVTYTGATSYKVTLGPLSEVSTVFGVSSLSGANETVKVTAPAVTPDGTPPSTVPFQFRNV